MCWCGCSSARERSRSEDRRGTPQNGNGRSVEVSGSVKVCNWETQRRRKAAACRASARVDGRRTTRRADRDGLSVSVSREEINKDCWSGVSGGEKRSECERARDERERRTQTCDGIEANWHRQRYREKTQSHDEGESDTHCIISKGPSAHTHLVCRFCCMIGRVTSRHAHNGRLSL